MEGLRGEEGKNLGDPQFYEHLRQPHLKLPESMPTKISSSSTNLRTTSKKKRLGMTPRITNKTCIKLIMADLNRVCSWCNTEKVEIACRCEYPPVLLCGACYIPHYRKFSGVKHMPSDIAATDLEENKQDQSENRKIEMKLQFQ